MAASTRQYERISVEEFEQWLGGFANFEEADTDAGETVYDIPLPCEDKTVRVFSTLERGVSRNSGEDAIRTVLWDHKHNAPAGGEKKTLRIQTWRSNLRPKIEDLVLNWRDYHNGECQECEQGIMVKREGSYGEFLGCSNYPRCQNTEQV